MNFRTTKASIRGMALPISVAAVKLLSDDDTCPYICEWRKQIIDKEPGLGFVSWRIQVARREKGNHTAAPENAVSDGSLAQGPENLMLVFKWRSFCQTTINRSCVWSFK